MNIFYISHDVEKCAEWAVDRHVTKMILETAQLLSTAHRVLDGSMYIDDSSGRKMKRWRLPDHRESLLYKATHINHPCAVWVRESRTNYNWLWHLLHAYCKEYTYRYGKVHAVMRSGLFDELIFCPKNLLTIGFTEPPSAMDEQYILSDTIDSYRNYYANGKKHLHKWTNRTPPYWINDYV